MIRPATADRVGLSTMCAARQRSSREGRRCTRPLGAGVVVALIGMLAACSGGGGATDNSDAESPSEASAESSASVSSNASSRDTTVSDAAALLADAVPTSLTPWETSTIDEAAELELDMIDQWRQEADFAGQLGPGGAQVLANFDESRRSFAESHVPQAFAALVQQSGPAAIGFRQIPRQTPAPAPSSFVGDIGATTTMTSAVMATAVTSLVDANPGTWADDSSEEYRPNRADGYSERVVISQRITVQAGGGRVHLEVDINSTATVTDASGATVATVSGTGRIIYDVLACPEADGRALGDYHISYNETAGSRSRSYAANAAFTLRNGDDAALQSIDIQFDVRRDASQDGTSTSAQVSMSGTAARGGGMSYGDGTVSSNGMSPDQTASSLGGTIALVGATVREVGKAAEKYWRSGKCIELQPSETTRDVDPQEELSIDTRAVGHFDRAEIDAPIRATLSGVATLEPLDTPQDPPATVTYTAGEEQGDEGTVTFKQVGRRGIGMIDETFTVAPQELRLDITGTGSTTVPGASVSGTSTATGVVLAFNEGTGRYENDAFPIEFDLSIGLPGCPSSAAFTKIGKISATPDEADPDALTIAFAQAQVDLGTVSCTIGSRTIDLPVATYEAGWTIALANQVVRLAEPKSFHYTGSDAVGTYAVDLTVSITRPEPDQSD